MRTYFIYILIFYISQTSQAQQENFFPLAIGNQYQVYNGFSYFYCEIEKDTTYPSGKTYFSLPYGVFEFGDTRVDSIGNIYTAIVPFTGGVSENGESLIFKATATVGDIWPVAWNFGSPIIDTLYAELLFSETMPVFGTLREVRSILLYENEGPPYIFWLAKGIGKIRDIFDDGTIVDLNYARIDNKIYGTIVSVKNEQVLTLDNFQVSQNYPNPFNGKTKIDITPSKNNFYIKLLIYNILGSEIYSEEILINGITTLTIDTEKLKLSSGSYYYSIISDNSIVTKKFLLLK